MSKRLMSDPTPEQIAKLPQWTQDHIRSLSRQVEDLQREMVRMAAAQPESEWFAEDMVGKGPGNGFINVKRFFTAHNMRFFHRGLFVEMIAREEGLDIQYSRQKDRDRRGFADDTIVLQPRSYQQISLIYPEKK